MLKTVFRWSVVVALLAAIVLGVSGGWSVRAKINGQEATTGEVLS